MKRFLSAMLVLILLIGMIPGISLVANAATTLTEAQFASKIAALRKEYPDGKYWSNKNGTVTSGTYKGTSLAGSSKCGSSTAYNDNCGTFALSGTELAWQCHGFARLMGHRIFGSDPSNWTKYTSKSRQIYAGDLIRIDINGNGTNENTKDHTIFVTKVTSSKIYYVDCNYVGPCQINWDGEMTLSTLETKLLYVLHQGNNALTGTGADTPVLTVKYHVNGGAIPGSGIASTTYKITVDEGLNMRATAGTSGTKVTALAKNTQFTVKRGDTKTADGYTWGKTTVNGKTGWVVISQYVSVVSTARNTDYYLVGSIVYRTSSASATFHNMTYGTNISAGFYHPDTLGLTREGYTFLGWSLSAEGGTVIEEDQAFKPEEIVPDLKNGSKTVTVYAIWEENAEPVDARLTFTLNEDGESYTLSGCDPTAEGELTIPAAYDGKPVTAIGSYAFRDCEGVIGVTIPDSITTIADYAFYNCYNLASLTIPKSVTHIGERLLVNCDSLSSIWVDADNPNYSSDSAGVLFDKDKTMLIAAPRDLTQYDVPTGVTGIADCAFQRCVWLTGITLPDTLAAIGDWAFAECWDLTNVTIPSRVTAIGERAFTYCGLTEITIPDSVTAIGADAFSSCDNLTTVTIGSGVTAIGYAAFDWCENLTDVYYNGTEAQWNAISIADENEELLNADITFLVETPDISTEFKGNFDFENYRVVFSDSDATHKNVRAVVYKLGDATVEDPSDENALKAIDANAQTYWGASHINKILLTDAGNYVVLLKYNIGTGAAIKVPMVLSVNADPKLIIDKNNKITVVESNGANINHRAVVYYLGDQTVEDIYDEAALTAIDAEPETVWKLNYINRLALTKGGNYVLHLCYNEGISAKLTVAQAFTVESIPSLSVDINNKVVVTEENAENRNHRAVVYYLGENTVEDPYDESEVKAAALTTSKTYWGLDAINKVELKDGGNYVVHLYYNVGTSEKRTLALDLTLNERPVLSVSADGKLSVTYTDPEINNPRAYIYNVGDAEIADIYDEAALKAIATPTQVWGLSSILKKQLTPGTYVVHFYYSIGTSAKKTVALKVTI